jgi:hypothetical protein
MAEELVDFPSDSLPPQDEEVRSSLSVKALARGRLLFPHERGIHVDPAFDESYLRFEGDSGIAGGLVW